MYKLKKGRKNKIKNFCLRFEIKDFIINNFKKAIGLQVDDFTIRTIDLSVFIANKYNFKLSDVVYHISRDMVDNIKQGYFSTMRTSSVFLSKREKQACPKLSNTFVSHFYSISFNGLTTADVGSFC